MLNAIKTNYHHNWEYLSVDGIYGPKSATAVKKFQEYRGISSDMSSKGPVLGDTTIRYIRESYNTVPKISAVPPSPIINKRRSDEVNKAQTGFDLITLLTNEGAPIYKELEKTFPLAYRRLSKRSNAPYFVFSKQQANHGGARYARFNLPESVSRYLGRISLAWSWITIFNDIKDYKEKCKSNNSTKSELFKIGTNIYVACTYSLDTVLSSPACKQLATKLAGRYAAAQTGTAFSTAGVTALSTIGMCIGAFLLGWEIGKLIGDIPVGEGRSVQDVIDNYIDQMWEHPYKTFGPTPNAIIIDSWKKLIDWNVNRVSNLKPLTPAEKQKLDLYLMQHPEMKIYATPPKYFPSVQK
ncbi:MAG: hypothetical protein HDS13_06815 [Bacteroides sp.]|nr:hypothetical protein [Bacteroides sp.]